MLTHKEYMQAKRDVAEYENMVSDKQLERRHSKDFAYEALCNYNDLEYNKVKVWEFKYKLAEERAKEKPDQLKIDSFKRHIKIYREEVKRYQEA